MPWLSSLAQHKSKFDRPGEVSNWSWFSMKPKNMRADAPHQSGSFFLPTFVPQQDPAFSVFCLLSSVFCPLKWISSHRPI
jgi:hypothetical protein